MLKMTNISSELDFRGPASNAKYRVVTPFPNEICVVLSFIYNVLHPSV